MSQPISPSMSDSCPKSTRIFTCGRVTLFCCMMVLAVNTLARGQDPTFRNPGFEETHSGNLPVGWFMPTAAAEAGFEYEASRKRPNEGRRCLAISRSPRDAKGQEWGVVMQGLRVEALRGRRFVLTLKVRTEKKAEAQFYVRQDSADQTVTSYDNLDNRRFDSSNWTDCTFEARIDDQAVAMSLGILMYGSGTIYVDDVSLEFPETSRSITARDTEGAVLSDVRLAVVTEQVDLLRGTEHRIFHRVADKSGHVVLETLRQPSRIHVFAFVEDSWRILQDASTEKLPHVYVLGSAHALNVIVSDAEGAPISGARVRMAPDAAGDFDDFFPPSTTDTTGALTIEPVTELEHWIHVTAPGFADVRCQVPSSRVDARKAKPTQVTLSESRRLWLRVSDLPDDARPWVEYKYPITGLDSGSTFIRHVAGDSICLTIPKDQKVRLTLHVANLEFDRTIDPGLADEDVEMTYEAK